MSRYSYQISVEMCQIMKTTMISFNVLFSVKIYFSLSGQIQSLFDFRLRFSGGDNIHEAIHTKDPCIVTSNSLDFWKICGRKKKHYNENMEILRLFISYITDKIIRKISIYHVIVKLPNLFWSAICRQQWQDLA